MITSQLTSQLTPRPQYVGLILLTRKSYLYSRYKLVRGDEFDENAGINK